MTNKELKKQHKKHVKFMKKTVKLWKELGIYIPVELRKYLKSKQS